MLHVDRFSDRAEAYAKHRPSYPDELLDHLAGYGLHSRASVADIGSGTGILTGLMLERGAEVFAVEPNRPMREEAERALQDRPGFHSVNGTAEATCLRDRSVDLITAAQAFHWFDLGPTRLEWRRICKPGAWVALMWNERIDEEPFTAGFGQLARAFVDQQGPTAFRRLADPTAEIADFFSPNSVQREEFANHQLLTLDGVKGRALSSSYWPHSGPAFSESMSRLEDLFAKHNEKGLVRLEYRTELFLGQV